MDSPIPSRRPFETKPPSFSDTSNFGIQNYQEFSPTSIESFNNQTQENRHLK